MKLHLLISAALTAILLASPAIAQTPVEAAAAEESAVHEATPETATQAAPRSDSPLRPRRTPR